MLASLLGWVGCSSVPPHPRVKGLDERFSGEMARAHVRALGELVPRLPGSRGDRRARRYLDRELRMAGLAVEELEEQAGRHLIARLPGVSSDELLLVAPYPTLAELDRLDDSGLAVLLEMARVFGAAPEPPYSLSFAFCETRPAEPDEGTLTAGSRENRWAALSTRDEARARVVAAGRSLARALAARGELARLRGVVVMDRVGDFRLRVARDLRSHPVFREIFWESATALGFEQVFPTDDGWASADGLQLGFRERGMDRIIVLTDEAVARPDHARAEASAEVSAGSLQTVGVVGVEALGRIMQRLAKVDAFSRQQAPTGPLPGPVE